jgi:glycerol-3-phosphate acyltransferase PlsY
MPACLILGLITWAIIFFSTRYVALASIGFGVSLPVCAFVIAWSAEDSGVGGKVLLACVIMSWIVWRHRSNIIRLRAGTENRFQKKN